MKSKRPILVVDDEPEILQSLKGLLRQDFEVNVANSGAEGIQILQQRPIHVVMTDQRMPVMTGVEFLRQIKGDHPEAMRLIFTGYADTSAVIAAINQGNVYRYVCKPWDPDELIAALKDAGDQYDRICERQRLLADLRAHEEKCLTFDEGLRVGQKLAPPDAAELEHLYQQGRALLTRLGAMLGETGKGAV